MANHKHVEILAQGVRAWNLWRQQDANIKPNLSGTNLYQAKLTGANLRQSDLRKADLREAELNETDLFKGDLRAANFRAANLTASDLRGANLSGAHMIGADLSRSDLQRADLRNARLDDAIIRDTNLESANLADAYLPNAQLVAAQLKHANLRGSNLQGTVLTSASLVGADLSMANLTGAQLYCTERDHWKIDGIKCHYAFWDQAGSQRTPGDREFKPGEFELLYRKSPTIEYRLENAHAPLQMLLMDHVVKTINHQLPGFELHLDSLILKGAPRAVFSVLHRKDGPRALELIHEHYQAQMNLTESLEVRKWINKWDRQLTEWAGR